MLELVSDVHVQSQESRWLLPTPGAFALALGLYSLGNCWQAAALSGMLGDSVALPLQVAKGFQKIVLLPCTVALVSWYLVILIHSGGTSWWRHLSDPKTSAILPTACMWLVTVIGSFTAGDA